MSSTECFSCKDKKRKFYCVDCLQEHLHDFRSKIRQASTERDSEVAKATRSLATVENRRLLRAELATLGDSISEVREETERIRHQVEAKRPYIATLRQSLNERRTHLKAAKSFTQPLTQTTHTATHSNRSSIKHDIVLAEDAVGQAQANLAATRRVLIKTLVETFDLREAVPAAPPPNTRLYSLSSSVYPKFSSASASYLAGAGMALFGRTTSFTSTTPGTQPVVLGKSEWSIAGLVLPVPGDLTRYTPDQITAAITHTLHFMRLLTFYLGVKLPFEVTWSGGPPGVGWAYIAAGSGPEDGGWASWTTPYPLFLTPASNSTSSSSSSSRNSSSSNNTSTTPSATEPPTSTLESFMTALCMLNYNVAYLSYTQGLEIPLSTTGETLRNLWNICCLNIDGLGRASHSTSTPLYQLPPPTSTFPLEFSQLLQITSAKKSSGSKSSSRGSSKGSGSKSRRVSNKVKVDEGEWDLVEVPEGDEGVG